MLIVIFEIAKHLMEKVFSMLEPMTPTRVAQTVSELPASKLHPVQNHCNRFHGQPIHSVTFFSPLEYLSPLMTHQLRLGTNKYMALGKYF